jgi:hypothetical protein
MPKIINKEAGKTLIILGRQISQAACCDVLAKITREDNVCICDFSEYYQLNRKKLKEKGRLEKHIDLTSLFNNNQSLLRNKYHDFIADWPGKNIWHGKTFKELFVWEGISLWWFSEPARKVIGEYGDFSKICEIVTIRDIVNSFAVSDIELFSCPACFSKTLKKIFPQVNISSIQPIKGNRFIRLMLTRTIMMFSAILKIIILKDKNTAKHHKKTGLISFNLYNWLSNGNIPIDRLYQGLVEDKTCHNNFNWLFVTDANFVDLILRKKLGSTLNLFKDIRNYYEDSSLVFVENKMSIGKVILLFLSVLHLLKYLRLSLDKGFRSSLEIEGINVFDILNEGLIRSFVINTFEAQLLSENFYNLNSHTKFENMVTYAEFFPQGRALIHGIKRADLNSRVIWHQHSMISRGKLMFINNRKEVNLSCTTDYIERFPVADKYLMWGRQAKSVVVPGYPEERVCLIGSYKYISTSTEPTSEVKEKVKILIVPSNFRRDWLFLFSLTFAAIHHINQNYDVLVTKHPQTDQKKFMEDLDDFGGSKATLHKGMTSNKVIMESDIVIAGVSTVVIDAILAGKYVIICKNPNDIWYGIDEDDIAKEGYGTGIHVVNNSDEMEDSLRKYTSFKNNLNTEKRKEIISNFLEYKNQEVVERFWSGVRHI